MITDSKLKFWIDNNLNVLFVGEAGVGKTARVREAFDQAGLKWLYFSASTLDPWVDFIGIPKEAQDEKGNKYIELIRPKPFAEDQVEAIFLDEYNRSPKKVRNAVMELLQFKSINGKRFNNLRIVWAAINPDDVKIEGGDEFEYDVERLDPAQKDRFEIHVDVPFKPDKGYFLKKYGEDIAENAIDWWNDLDQKTRRGVSPRRLDYALNVYVKGGDIRDVLPSNVNVSKLITELKNGSYIKLMKAVFVQRNVDEAKKFLAVRNNYDNTIQRILKSEDMIKFFIPCVKEEDLVNLMASESKVYNHTVDNLEVYDSTVKNILDVNGNSKLAKKLKKEPKLVQMVHDLKAIAINKQFTQYTFSNPNLIVKPVIKNRFSVMFGSVNGQSFSNFVKDSSSIQNALKRGTQYRTGIFHKIAANVGNAETYSDYLTALNILCNIIGSSHKDSLKSQIFQGLPELFGFLVRKTIDTSFGLETVQSILAKLKVQNGRVDKVEEFLFTNSKLYV